MDVYQVFFLSILWILAAQTKTCHAFYCDAYDNCYWYSLWYIWVVIAVIVIKVTCVGCYFCWYKKRRTNVPPTFTAPTAVVSQENQARPIGIANPGYYPGMQQGTKMNEYSIQMQPPPYTSNAPQSGEPPPYPTQQYTHAMPPIAVAAPPPYSAPAQQGVTQEAQTSYSQQSSTVNSA